MKHQRGPMSFLQMMHHVDVEVAQPYLTRDELLETVRRLEDLGLIAERRNLLGYEHFSLTEKGEQAFDETVFGTQRIARSKDA